MVKIFGLVGLMLLFSQYSFSQKINWCITDTMDSIAIVNDPSILERRAELEAYTQNYINQKSKSEEVLIIPVVFHVLHRYGEERILMDQMVKALEIVNDDYAALNSDLNGVVNEFRDIIGTANIEFRLAQIDPDGNCTNGVVYYDTDLTHMASNSLKYTIQNWDPESYLNVWTVNSIESGAAAWSQYPGVTPALDGVVSIYRYIGTGHTLSHEIGHYLNLIHPWGSTNEPGLEINCDMDDKVDDTPNTLGSESTCNLSQYSCASLDNVQNIMDYGTCDAMLTSGQVDRMRAALNSSVGSRNNLWSDANLAKTGTQDDYTSFDCSPVADFSSVGEMIFKGDSVSYKAFENGGKALSWKWEFEAGEQANSTIQNPVVVYNTEGLYKVKLKVINDIGEDILERENNIRVLDTLQGIIAPAIVDMGDDEFPYYPSDSQKQWIFESKEKGNWELFEGDGNSALGILNQDNSIDSRTSVITSNINLSEISNPNFIYFDWAYAQREAENNDELKVYVSNNGGKNWILRFTTRGKSLVTNDGSFVSTVFTPQTDEWKTGEVNMAYNKNDNHVQLKFEMISGGGNALYIDNIQIGTPTTGIHSSYLNESISVYPNPTSQTININYTTQHAGNYVLKVYNMLGSLVYKTNVESDARNNSIVLDKNDLNIQDGIYLVEMVTNTRKISTRLIITD